MDPYRLGGLHQLLPRKNQQLAFRSSSHEALTSAHGPVGPTGADAASDACRIAGIIHKNTDFMMYIAGDKNLGLKFLAALSPRSKKLYVEARLVGGKIPSEERSPREEGVETRTRNQTPAVIRCCSFLLRRF